MGEVPGRDFPPQLLFRCPGQSLSPGFHVLTPGRALPPCPPLPLVPGSCWHFSDFSHSSNLLQTNQPEVLGRNSHSRGSRSLWSPGKGLCGRMKVSGWKCCAGGDCWDRGSSTNKHQCPCCMCSSGLPERSDHFLMPLLATWDLRIRTVPHVS